jgi:hypothetical protein
LATVGREAWGVERRKASGQRVDRMLSSEALESMAPNPTAHGTQPVAPYPNHSVVHLPPREDHNRQVIGDRRAELFDVAEHGV